MRKYLLSIVIGLVFVFGLVSQGYAASPIVINNGNSYKFVNNSSVSRVVQTNATYVTRMYDYAIYNANGSANSEKQLSYDTSLTVPAGGYLVVTTDTAEAVTFTYDSELSVSESNPALAGGTINQGISYKWINNSSASQIVLTNATYVTRMFDYAIYNANGSTNSEEQLSYDTALTVPAGGYLVVTTVTADAVKFGGYYDAFTGSNSVNPALAGGTINQGISYKWVNNSAASQIVLTNATYVTRMFDYAIYNADGSTNSEKQLSYDTALTVPAGGYLVVTTDTADAVKFGGYYDIFTGSNTAKPALAGGTINQGISYKWVNHSSASQIVLTNATYVTRMFDYAIYNANGSTNSEKLISYDTALTVPAGGYLVVTTDTADAVKFGGCYDAFTGSNSANPALLKKSLGQNIHGLWINKSSASQVVLTNATYVTRMFDYTIYNANGSVNSQEQSSYDTSLTVPAGGYLSATGRTTSAVILGGYFDCFADSRPAVPTGLKATPGNAKVVLTWNANTETNLKGYYLTYKPNGGSWSVKYVAAPTTSYTFAGLTNDVVYSFRIKAVNTSNVCSAYSSTVLSMPFVLPSVPTGLKATSGNAQVSLSWNANTESNLRGYTMAYMPAGGSWSYKLILAPTHAYTLTGLTNGKEYTFKIRACTNTDLVSAYSSTVSAIPSAAPLVISYSPKDNATGIARTANLVLTFNQNVSAVAGRNIYIKKTADNTTVETIPVTDTARVAIAASKVIINPSTTLAANTGYYVLMSTGALKNATGDLYAGITIKTIWNFTTATATPLVSSYSPADNATGLSRTTNLVLTFNQNVSAVSGKNIYVKKTADNTTVETIPVTDTARVTVSGAKVTINPTTTLAANTSYYVLISSGAFKGVNGGLYAGITSKTIWNFTTSAT